MKLSKEDIQAIASEVKRLQDNEPKQPTTTIKTGASAQKPTRAQKVGNPKGANNDTSKKEDIMQNIAKWGIFTIWLIAFVVVLVKVTPYIFN